MNDKIYVAKLGKAVGLKGHLRLFIDSDFPEQFKKGASFTTNKKTTLIVEEYNSNRDTIKFEGYNDIDTSKKLTNQHLFVSFDQTKENCNLNKDEYFWFDIMNSKVYEDDKLLGEVVEIHRYPLNDYLEIATSDELVKQGLSKTFLIPYIKDTYIVSVDTINKRIETKSSFEILENS